jgi:hypothetical protein
MSGQRQKFFHRLNLALGEPHDPPVNPADGIAAGDSTGSHYSRN